MKYSIDSIKEKLQNTKVLFFDLDGTLIDTEPIYFRFWKEASKYYGYELSDEEALSMRSRDHNSGVEFFKTIHDGKLDYHQVRNKRIELMNEYLKTHPITLKPGVVEFLSKMQKEGKTLFIVSANSVAKSNQILTSLNIDKYFTGVISAKDVKRGKPFPDVFIEACRQVNVNPNEAIVFEDSPNGLKASSNAGCFTIMVEDLTKYSLDMDYVHAAISSFFDIL